MPLSVTDVALRMRSAMGALRALERFLLPASCLLCEEPVPPQEGDALVCGVCRLRWRALPHPQCSRCGQPSGPAPECLLCAEWPPDLSRVQSAVWLEGLARDAVHRLKYDGWWRVAEAMAQPMRGLAPLTAEVSLIPVPLGARRQRRRGYNQSEHIARALASRSGLALRADVLRRTRETTTQTALTPDGRRANVAGAFVATPVPGLRVVLVDDVFTTGATLVAAAEALTRAGADRVEAVTFARAPLPVS